MSEKRLRILYPVFRIPLFIFITTVVITAGFIASYALYIPETNSAPPFEIYSEDKVLLYKLIPESESDIILPKVAIIIDDIGYDKVIAEKFLRLNAAITFSVLPQSPSGDSIIQQARKKGIEIMLHLPMEPLEYPEIKPGPDAIYAEMSPNQVIGQLKKNLDTVPYAVGVNNHMGSKITGNFSQMYQILSVLKQKDLFFIDSFTTVESICKPSAHILQIPFAKRNVFLDHIQDPEMIRRQIEHLICVAKSYGEAVGIGHPHAVTYRVLQEMLPELKNKVKLVFASELVHTI